MKYLKISILTIICCFVSFVVYKAIQQNTCEIPTHKASYRSIEEKLTISGEIEPSKEIEVKSPMSGVLEKLFVKVGDKIKTGEPIAKVQFVKDPLEYKNLLKQLEIQESQYRNQKSRYDRILHLYNKELISKEEYEQERYQFEVSESELDAIRSEIQMIQGIYLQQGITNIVKATGDGTILQLPVKEGGSVMARGTFSEGSTIVRIADLQSLIFKGYVLESDVLKVKKGTEVNIQVATNKNAIIKGQVILVAPKAEIVEDAVKFEVTALVHVNDSIREFLLAGCSATAELICNKKDSVLSIDEKYLLFEGDSTFIDIVENKKIKKQYIQTGISDGIYTQITSGIDSTTLIKK